MAFDKSRTLANALTFVAWLATAGLGLLAVYLLRQILFGVSALLGAEPNAAQAIATWSIVVLALVWIAFAIGTAEYHRKHVGTPQSYRVFIVAFAVELFIIAIYILL